LRQAFLPVAYLPFRRVNAQGEMLGRDRGTFIVRTADANPMALASVLRQEIPRARPEFRVSNIRTQKELIESQTVRERLLAMLAIFFAVVALLLAGIGLYGVLNYSVQQRRREIGIRLAIGAPAGAIARLVTMDIVLMVIAGAMGGLAIGMASARYIETLFYQVKPGDFGVLALPALALFGAALLASLPTVIRAVRIDPVETLRSD
jgi:ABC-type antimicrobial peptide transport system permease subunit